MRNKRYSLTCLLLIAVVTLLVNAAGAQNPNCDELKRRVDDAARAYHAALMQARAIGRNIASYDSAIKKLENDLAANDKRKVQAERNLADAERDQAKCKRDLNALPAAGCARVTQRIAMAQRNIAEANANHNKLAAELATYQRKIADARVSATAANANATTAQQELTAANQAYASAGCTNESNNQK